MATQEELRLQAIQSQGSAAPQPEFMAGPNAINAQAQPQQRRELGTEEEAQALNQFMKDTGRDGMSTEDWNRRAQKLIDWRGANPKKLGGPRAPDSRLATGPLPTGVEEIDLAGQTVTTRAPKTPTHTRDIPSLEGLAPDDPLRLRKMRADEGVEMRKGASAWTRARLALKPSHPDIKAEALRKMVAENLADFPPELGEPIRYDKILGEFQIRGKVTPEDVRKGLDSEANVGKWRWVSMDGTGIELADIADMADPKEWLSLVGSIVGTGKAKLIPINIGQGKKLAAGGFGGGLAGRAAGESISIALDWGINGNFPTVDQLQEMGWDGLAIETFASVSGELGSKILRTGGVWGQEALARVKGKQAVFGNAEELAVHNKNLKETQEDMVRVRDTLGREDLAVTEGTATHSIDQIEEESFKMSTASKPVQRSANKAEARTKRTTSDYIDAVFGGNEKFMGDQFGTITKANRVLSDADIIVATNNRGTIRFAPQLEPEFGINIRAGSDGWQVKGAKMIERDGAGEVVKDLSGLGMGKKLYIAAAEEASSYGKVLRSDDNVTEAAYGLWKSLDGHPSIGKLNWNRNAVFNDTLKRWEVPAGESVVSMAKLDPISPLMLRDMQKVGRGEGGRFVANKDRARFFRTPGRKELSTLVEEMDNNPFIRQDWKKAMLADYDAVVNKDGVFSEVAFDAWKKDTRHAQEAIFSPRELQQIQSAGGIRAVVGVGEQAVENRLGTLARVLKTDPSHTMFKDPSSKGMWAQLKSLNTRDRQRAMKTLDAMDMGDPIRGIFRDELRLDLLNRTKGSNSSGYEKWLSSNGTLIDDVLGPQQAVPYRDHLRTVGNIIKRRSDRGMVRSTGVDANPTGLALTRVIFGPLSRAQRFFSAARKGQVRSGAAEIGDIITDPRLLRELIEIRMLPVESRQVMRVLQETGLIDNFWFDAENFNADNEEHRSIVAGTVLEMLQNEFAEFDASRLGQ